MTVVKRIFWKTGLLLLLAAGGCAALYGMSDRADPPDIDWQTVTPAEVETLIESGELDPSAAFRWNDKTDFTPLMAVVSREGDLDVLDVLVRHGADIDWQADEKDLGITPLGMALFDGNILHATRLLELGADAARKGASVPPVFYTLHSSKLESDLRREMIELLLDHGADINAVETRLRQHKLIFTPVMTVAGFSAVNKNVDSYAGLLSYLVSRGADIDMIPDGSYMGAMQLAAMGKDDTVMKELIALGGDVNLVNANRCNTPLLTFAAAGQNMEVFDLLIAAGADLDYTCPNGQNILSGVREREANPARYEMFTKIGIDEDKFPTEQSWVDFADEIIARIKALCREKRYNICSQLEESGEAYAENRIFFPAYPVFRASRPEAV